MKRSTITSEGSPGFPGEIVIVHDDSGRIVSIDMQGADLTADQYLWFAKKIFKEDFLPTLPAELPVVFNASKLRFHSGNQEITFDMFYDRYKKKVNPDRVKKKWNALTGSDKALAYAGIIPYDRYLVKESWRTKADPETYLAKRMWLTNWNTLQL